MLQMVRMSTFQRGNFTHGCTDPQDSQNHQNHQNHQERQDSQDHQNHQERQDHQGAQARGADHLFVKCKLPFDFMFHECKHVFILLQLFHFHFAIFKHYFY